jgi:hypothetical protein
MKATEAMTTRACKRRRTMKANMKGREGADA